MAGSGRGLGGRLSLVAANAVLLLLSVELVLRGLEMAHVVTVPPLWFAEAPLVPPLRTALVPTAGTGVRYDPQLGWANAPGTHDRHGWWETVDDRGERTLPQPDAPRHTVVFLGDSFTFGSGVENDQTYAARLAARWPDVAVHDLAVPGYGHDQMWLAWQALVQADDPRAHADVVVVATIAADLDRDAVDWFFQPKPRYVATDDGLALRGVPVPTMDEVRARVRWVPKAIQALRIARLLAAGPPNKTDTLPLATAIARALATSIRAQGGVPVFVGLPTGIPARADPSWHAAYCPDDLARCLDVYAPFEAAGGPALVSPVSEHWDARGHAVVADALAPVLREILDDLPVPASEAEAPPPVARPVHAPVP